MSYDTYMYNIIALYLHVTWFDKPGLVSQHLVDGEKVDHLRRDILQTLQPLGVAVIFQKLSFKNGYLHKR